MADRRGSRHALHLRKGPGGELRFVLKPAQPGLQLAARTPEAHPLALRWSAQRADIEAEAG